MHRDPKLCTNAGEQHGSPPSPVPISYRHLDGRSYVPETRTISILSQPNLCEVEHPPVATSATASTGMTRALRISLPPSFDGSVHDVTEHKASKAERRLRRTRLHVRHPPPGLRSRMSTPTTLTLSSA
jgi:hypothetical protein